MRQLSKLWKTSEKINTTIRFVFEHFGRVAGTLSSFLFVDQLKLPNEFNAQTFRKFKEHIFEEMCKVEAEVEKRITFIEVSNNGDSLSPDKLCAIESAAISNPDMSIYVYLHSHSPEEAINHSSQPVKKLRERYKNVLFLTEDLNKFLVGTRLVNFTKRLEWGESPHAIKHFADAVRAAILYIYGGVSLDWGTIVTRSLKCLKNLARQDIVNETSILRNDVMVFDRRHKLIDIYMRMMEFQYDPSEEESVGSNALTSAGQVFCGLPDLVNTNGEGFVCKNNFTMIVPYIDAFKRIPSVTEVTLPSNDFKYSSVEYFRWSYAVLFPKGENYHVASNFHTSLISLYCPLSYGISVT